MPGPLPILLLSLCAAPAWAQPAGDPPADSQSQEAAAAKAPDENDAKTLQEVFQKVQEIAEIPKDKIQEGLHAIFDKIVKLRNKQARDQAMALYLEELKKAGDKPEPPSKDLGPPSLGSVLWSQRVRVAQDMKRQDPENPRWWSESGQNYYLEKDYENAFQDSGRAIELGARDPTTFTVYAGAAHHLGDYQLATQASSFALGMEPDNQKALAIFKLSQNQPSERSLPSALKDAEDANSWQPGPAGTAGTGVRAGGAGRERQAEALDAAIRQSAAFTKEAAQSLGVQDYSGAHAFATQAIDKNPKNAQAWNYRAIADNKLGRYDDAVSDAGQALALVPGNSPALQSRAWALSKKGRYQEALTDVASVLEIEPQNSFAYQNRAFALAGLGDRDGMLDSLKLSAQLDPRFLGRYQQALQAPQDRDVLYLFDDAPATLPAPAPGAKNRRFLRLSLWVLLGGLLTGLGLLHIFSPTWREAVKTTIRRVIGPAPPAATARGAPSGSFWGQYEMIRELGSGGMGVVYEAKDVALERPVAIKRMREEIRKDPRERQRFMSEAKTVAALHHPHIVDIYSVVEDGEEVYLVFECVKGRTLSEVLGDKGKLGFEAARRVIKGACLAVDYAHRHKVIHRDLKPSNIMITEDGIAKVMDFGVARQAQEAMSKLVLTNTIVGTPPYMAPEQEQGQVRPESDVFALAAMFYEALSGQRPFAGQGAGLLLNKINGKYIPISDVVLDGLPPGLDKVLAKGLAADPDQRFRTAGELAQALDALGDPRLV